MVLTIVMLLSSGCGSKEPSMVLNGTIEADKYSVISETAGEVIDVLIDEGAVVKPGDVVARIDSEAQKLTVQKAEALVEIAQIQLDNLRAGPEESALKQAESAAGAAKASLSAAKSTVTYWDNTLASLKANPGAPPGDISNADYQLKLAKNKQTAAQWDYTAAQAKYNELKNSASESQTGQTGDTATGRAIQSAQAQLKQANADLELAKLGLSKCDITAGTRGICTTIYFKLGDMAAQGSTIAEITNLQKLRVNVYVPQSKLLNIHLGQELDIKGIPQAKGRIIQIADKAEYTPRNVETTEEKQSTVFKVKIEIYQGWDSLKPGMSVDVTIPEMAS